MCDQGYKMENNKCVVDHTTRCKEGYQLKNGKCVGKNECLINFVLTFNFPFKLYHLHLLFSFLLDINECIVGKSSPCHASLKCLNFEGSFRCVEKCTISNGYRLVYSQGKEFCVGKFVMLLHRLNDYSIH